MADITCLTAVQLVLCRCLSLPCLSVSITHRLAGMSLPSPLSNSLMPDPNLANSVQALRAGLAEALELTGTTSRDVWKPFWGAHQRFFKLLCISLKVPAAGRSLSSWHMSGYTCRGQTEMQPCSAHGQLRDLKSSSASFMLSNCNQYCLSMHLSPPQGLTEALVMLHDAAAGHLTITHCSIIHSRECKVALPAGRSCHACWQQSYAPNCGVC